MEYECGRVASEHLDEKFCLFKISLYIELQTFRDMIKLTLTEFIVV